MSRARLSAAARRAETEGDAEMRLVLNSWVYITAAMSDDSSQGVRKGISRDTRGRCSRDWRCDRSGYGGVSRGPRQCDAREVYDERLKLQALNSWSRAMEIADLSGYSKAVVER